MQRKDLVRHVLRSFGWPALVPAEGIVHKPGWWAGASVGCPLHTLLPLYALTQAEWRRGSLWFGSFVAEAVCGVSGAGGTPVGHRHLHEECDPVNVAERRSFNI